CRNRFAITGETAEPCGVPRSRCCKVPSGRASGAASQRRTYSTTHGRSVTAWIALTARCHGMVSKNFRMSRSITQSFSQHRCRQAATASNPERPGRQPWESGWKTCSAFASITPATTVCATLSATAGTPGILVPPPCGFGISTARTGGGEQVPEESRFQILYRLFFRSDSNSAIVTASTPGAPLFALTFSHASQTACFEIANGLPGASTSSIRFLPEHFRLIRRIKPRTTRPLRSAPVTGTSPLLRTGPPARPATVLSPLRFSRSGCSLSAGPGNRDRPVSGRAFSCSVRKPQTGLASSACRTPPGQQADIRQAHPGGAETPRLRCRLRVSARQQRFARARLPGPRLTPNWRLFLIAHHDGLQPAQHEAAWSPPPQVGSEGPRNLHLPHSTASTTRSYIRPSLRSGHTPAPTGPQGEVPVAKISEGESSLVRT